jgi:protein-L-isoaspartate(D-aspartate) O-methyltransferase
MLARQRMVDAQLRARGIADPGVLRAMLTVPREAFVPAALAGRAYDDAALPIGAGQTISQPYIVALMAEALRIGPDDRVLEVGTGSGYAAAVLTKLAREVYTVEARVALAAEARRRLAELGFANVHVVEGDGTRGLPGRAPFAAISVAAAAEAIPEALLDQLDAGGGRLVMPVGEMLGEQVLVRVTRTGAALHRDILTEVRFVPLLRGAPPPSNF